MQVEMQTIRANRNFRGVTISVTAFGNAVLIVSLANGVGAFDAVKLDEQVADKGG
jgi:hypothetical protein